MASEKQKKAKDPQEQFEREMIEVSEAEKERKKLFTPPRESKTDKITNRRLITGGVIFLLAVIGIATIFAGVVRFGFKLFDNTEEKLEYQAQLATLVLYDPLPFETPDQANQQVLLQSSVWAALMNEDLTLYDVDEYGFYLLPVADVDRYFARLFGPAYSLTHQSFDDGGAEFVYDEERGAYIVPPTNFPSGFTPVVEKIKTSFDNKVVTVGYISPRTSMQSTDSTAVSKYVDYIFEKQNGTFYLVAVRESEMQVAAPVTDDETN